MEIKKGDGKFYIGDDEQNPTAEITFKPQGNDTFDVDHTYVSEELRGQGIAGKLTDKMVSFAREEGKKIKPTCPYVKEKWKKHRNTMTCWLTNSRTAHGKQRQGYVTLAFVV